MSPPRVVVLVPAAGAGRRMGGVRKPWIEVGGRSVLAWALSPFLRRSDVVEVVVATPDGTLPSDPECSDGRVRGVVGGASRLESVEAAFRAAVSESELVAVHDGARPFPPSGTVDACLRVAASGAVAVAGINAVDTIKCADDRGRILRTPPRAQLWCAQTPQAFPRPLFARALAWCAENGCSPTDDAAMAEAMTLATEPTLASRDASPSLPTADQNQGRHEPRESPVRMRMVVGSALNLKITSRQDLVAAEAYISEGLV